MSVMHPLPLAMSGISTVAADTLLSAIWQGAVLAAIVAFCLHLLPRASAALRSLLWTAVLVIVAALHLRPLMLAGAPSSAPAASLHGVEVDSRWAAALVCLWALLSVVRLISLTTSAMRLRFIARRATVIAADPEIRSLLRHGARTVDLCTSDEVDRPCVIGFVSPRILLPPALVERLQPAELVHVVLHEMEHLRRGDHWLNLFQKLALALFPLNPVLALVERRLCLERELACDDGVLRRTRARKIYATCLTSLAEHALTRRGLSLALGAWEKRSELSRRVQRILARPQLAMSRLSTGVVSVALVGGLVGGAAALTRCPQVVHFLPAANSVASAEVGSPAPLRMDLASSTRTVQTLGGTKASFVQARFEVPPTPRIAPLNIAKQVATPPAAKKHARRSGSQTRSTSQQRSGYRGRSGSQVTLIGLGESERSRSRVVYTALPNPQFTYAAVPWLNGWIIVQL